MQCQRDLNKEAYIVNITTSNPQNAQLKSVAKMIGKVYNTDLMLKWTLGLPASRVAQWKRAGPITQRSVDRNHALLIFFLFTLHHRRARERERERERELELGRRRTPTKTWRILQGL